MKVLVFFGLLVCCVLATLPYAEGCGPSEGPEPGKFSKHAEENEYALPSMSKIEEDPLEIDIFPPEHYPGDVIAKTDFSSVSKALDDVMRAGDLLHDRRCAIGVANEGTAKLSNPRWAFYSGQIQSSMPFEIVKGKTGLSLFVKRKGMASGSVGVITYDIEGTDYKVAVMWSVPFDFNIYDVWYNTKVYPKSVATDKDLWNQMYHEAGAWKTGGYESRTEFGVKMRATMTHNHESKLVVWVNADGFDANGDYDLCLDCKYHPGRVGKYCTQECFAKGWCWVDKGCSTRADCAGRHQCQGKC